MHRQTSPDLAHACKMVRHTSDFKGTPPGNIPPVIFRRRRESLLHYDHLAYLADLAAVWGELAASGKEEFKHTLDYACSNSA